MNTHSHVVNVIFAGTPHIATYVLTGLMNNDQMQVRAVITKPSVVKRKKIIHSPVYQVATAYCLPIFQPASKEELINVFATMKCDVFITCAYGFFIPHFILKKHQFNLNFHASLLPQYRGGAPIHYAILNQDRETGISIMEMTPLMDAGPVYWQATVPISKNDTQLSLSVKLGEVAGTLCHNVINQILNQKLQPVPQNEKLVSFAYHITKQQAQINWQNPAVLIHACIRAMYNKPYAFTFLHSKKVLIHESQTVDDLVAGSWKSAQPGQVVAQNKQGLYVKCQDGLLLIKKLQFANKKVAQAHTLINLIHINDCFG